MARIAVIHEVHSISFRILAQMMRNLGFDTRVAGASWAPYIEGFHHWTGTGKDLVNGIIELKDTPADAILLDTHPDTEKKLRAKGWGGKILIVWQMPVGPEWVEKNFKPGKGVGCLAWSRTVGNMLAKMNVCPNDFFWPIYVGSLDQTERTTIGDYLITCLENAAGWSNVPVLTQCRDHPETKLRLYGGGPPDWSKKIPQPQLFGEIRSSLAMFHLKPFDTPGLAVMEAVLQGVPLILPPVWAHKTGFGEFYIENETCLYVETNIDAVVVAARKLRDPETNYRIGREARRRLLAASDWNVTKDRFSKLVEGIYNT